MIRQTCTIDTPEAALRWCASASDMETFKSRVLDSSEKISLDFVDGGRMMSGQNIPAGLTDWRYTDMNLIDQYTLPSRNNITEGSTSCHLFYLLVLLPIWVSAMVTVFSALAISVCLETLQNRQPYALLLWSMEWSICHTTSKLLALSIKLDITWLYVILYSCVRR